MSEFYFNKAQEAYDAIVAGTGISGGWAAKELCDNGLKTLVVHIKDYTTNGAVTSPKSIL